MAARTGKRFVTMDDFENAKDKVMMGAERRSMVMSDDERKLTAYHEAGHAVVGLNVPQHDPIHKATIIPRGRALGLVLSLPERDQLSVTMAKYKSMIAMAMGGKVAEELVFGPENVTSGAASDIQQVSRIARAMVTKFGMSEKLGNIDYAGEQFTYLGPQSGGVNAGPDTHELIDQEVRKLVDEGYETAKRILTEKRDDLDRLANGLLEYETLTGKEITRVINGQPLNRGGDDDDKAARTGGRASPPSPRPARRRGRRATTGWSPSRSPDRPTTTGRIGSRRQRRRLPCVSGVDGFPAPARPLRRRPSARSRAAAAEEVRQVRGEAGVAAVEGVLEELAHQPERLLVEARSRGARRGSRRPGRSRSGARGRWRRRSRRRLRRR